MVKKTKMEEFNAMVYVPHMAVSYVGAHQTMQKLSDANANFDKGAKICICFNKADKVTHSFLFGLAEYINANPEFQWSVQHSNHPDDLARSLEELAPRIRILGEDETPYVKIELKQL